MDFNTPEQVEALFDAARGAYRLSKMMRYSVQRVTRWRRLKHIPDVVVKAHLPLFKRIMVSAEVTE